MSEKKDYTPYKQDDQEGSNDLTSNIGAGSTEPAKLNGWNEQFEENTSQGEK